MSKKEVETITIDLKQIEIDELTRRVDGLCGAMEKVIEAINTGRKIKVIDE